MGSKGCFAVGKFLFQNTRLSCKSLDFTVQMDTEALSLLVPNADARLLAVGSGVEDDVVLEHEGYPACHAVLLAHYRRTLMMAYVDRQDGTYPSIVSKGSGPLDESCCMSCRLETQYCTSSVSIEGACSPMRNSTSRLKDCHSRLPATCACIWISS